MSATSTFMYIDNADIDIIAIAIDDKNSTNIDGDDSIIIGIDGKDNVGIHNAITAEQQRSSGQQ